MDKSNAQIKRGRYCYAYHFVGRLYHFFVNHEGVTEINSDEAEIYINTKDRLIMIANALGIDDTSKLDEF